jgi:hypothetical protein
VTAPESEPIQLLLRAAAALFGSGRITEDVKLPPELLAGFRREDVLGPTGRIVVLVRNVLAGVTWHYETFFPNRPESNQPMPAMVRSLLGPPGEVPRDAALVEWARRCRHRPPQHEGYNQGSDEILLGYGRVPIDSQGRRAAFQAERTEGKRDEATTDVPRAAWAAWSEICDNDRERIALDIYLEPKSLCIATLVIEHPQAPGEERRLLHQMLSGAWSLASIGVAHYRRLWQKAVSVEFDRKITGTPLPDPIKPSYQEIYGEIARQLRDLFRFVAGAFHSPVAGLFMPDFHNGIGVVSHVGYQLDPLVFRLPPDFRGITSAYCLSVEPQGTGRSSAHQIATGEEIRNIYKSLGLGYPDRVPVEARGRGAYVTDSFLARGLMEAGPEVRSPLVGPWVYASVPLDRRVWGDLAVDKKLLEGGGGNNKKDLLSAVLKLQGRIQHELDRPGPEAPRFASFELRRLHEWAGVIGLVFQRFVRAYEQELTDSLMSGTVACLFQAIGHRGPGRRFDGFAKELHFHCRAKCVVLGRRVQGRLMIEGECCEDETLGEAVRKDLGQWRGRPERGEIVIGDARYSRFYLAIRPPDHSVSDGVLAVVGAPHELDADDPEPSREARGFPRILERGIRALERPTFQALQACDNVQRILEDARPGRATVAPGKSTRVADPEEPKLKEMWRTIKEAAKKSESVAQDFAALIREAAKCCTREDLPKLFGFGSATIVQEIAEVMHEKWEHLVPKKRNRRPSGEQMQALKKSFEDLYKRVCDSVIQ